jgi:hypothetical protein
MAILATPRARGTAEKREKAKREQLLSACGAGLTVEHETWSANVMYHPPSCGA